jgi:hypothetical protein
MRLELRYAGLFSQVNGRDPFESSYTAYDKHVHDERQRQVYGR